MMKFLGYIIIIAIVIFGIFGFLILLEYLRYFKRKVVLRLRHKLESQTFEDISSSSEEVVSDD